MTFDYFAVRLNGERAAGKTIKLNIDFTDLKQPSRLVIENGVLNNHASKLIEDADAKISLAKRTRLHALQLQCEIQASSEIYHRHIAPNPRRLHIDLDSRD